LEWRLNELQELIRRFPPRPGVRVDQEAFEDYLKELLDRGKQAFLEGEYKNADAKIWVAMRLDPTRERHSVDLILNTLTKELYYNNYSTWLSDKEIEKYLSDPKLSNMILHDDDKKAVLKLLSDLQKNSKWQYCDGVINPGGARKVYCRRIIERIASYGEPVIPILLRELNSKNDYYRKYVIEALSAFNYIDVVSQVLNRFK
jgi:hypothetical protein